MNYFDAHCHLQFKDYDADREAALARMRERGVGAIVVGTDLETSKAAIELARRHDFLWASVGLHPTEKHIGLSYVELEELAKDPKVVTIGECGLDYFHSADTKEEQKERFIKQIGFAQKLRKPLIVHCRDAHEDCSNILQNVSTSVPVIMHFFTGTAELAQRYLDLGCCLSFAGPITFTDMYDETIRATPLDRLLSETDSPFAAPAPHRGRRNEPAFVAEVVNKLATVKEMRAEEMSRQVVQNARKVFGLQ